jgi:hypothetical protein
MLGSTATMSRSPGRHAKRTLLSLGFTQWRWRPMRCHPTSNLPVGRS